MKRVQMTMVIAAAAGLLAPAGAWQLKTPPDWKWRTDTPAALVTEGGKIEAIEEGREWYFVAMPPGWHVTTGPGALLYHPDYLGRGNFGVEAEIFLFPGDSDEGYGVFVGGRSLDDSSGTPGYLAFLAHRDGRAGIFRREGRDLVAVADWMANDAVVPHAGGEGTARNVLRVDAGLSDIAFSANGTPITTIPRAGHDLSGHVGFRIGAKVNLHASRLDVTYRLAPVPK